MLETNEEKSPQQSPSHFLNPVNLGLGGGSLLMHLPFVKSRFGSGATEGKNDYDVPHVVGVGFGGIGYGADGKPLPGTLATYRSMAKHPTIALAEAAIVLTVLAAEWRVEVDEDLKDDSAATRGKLILERELIGRRTKLLAGMLRSIRYGWKSHEVVYSPKKLPDGDTYTGLQKVKQLAGENVELLADRAGNLLQLTAGGAKLDAPYYLHVVHDKEDDNWFGCARLENLRRTWANWLHLEDLKMRLVRKGTGTVAMVGVPSEDPRNTALGLTPNLDGGKRLANLVTEGYSVAFHNLVGVDPRSVQNIAELAGKSTTAIETIDVGNPGQMLDAITKDLEYYDKLLVRGMLQPERTLTEATMGGSRADSESHGDLAVAGAEVVHEDLVEQLNEQTTKWLIVENCGPDYEGRIRIAAMPLQDEEKQKLAQVFDALLTDPQFRTGLIKSMGNTGVRGLITSLGIKLQLEKDFELEELEAPADALNEDEATAANSAVKTQRQAGTGR